MREATRSSQATTGGRVAAEFTRALPSNVAATAHAEPDAPRQSAQRLWAGSIQASPRLVAQRALLRGWQGGDCAREVVQAQFDLGALKLGNPALYGELLAKAGPGWDVVAKAARLQPLAALTANGEELLTLLKGVVPTPEQFPLLTAALRAAGSVAALRALIGFLLGKNLAMVAALALVPGLMTLQATLGSGDAVVKLVQSMGAAVTSLADVTQVDELLRYAGTADQLLALHGQVGNRAALQALAKLVPGAPALLGELLALVPDVAKLRTLLPLVGAPAELKTLIAKVNVDTLIALLGNPAYRAPGRAAGTIVDAWLNRDSWSNDGDVVSGILYHYEKHGGGMTLDAYTQYGLATWALPRPPAWTKLTKTGDGVKVTLGARGGNFTPGGKILTCW